MKKNCQTDKDKQKSKFMPYKPKTRSRKCYTKVLPETKTKTSCREVGIKVGGREVGIKVGGREVGIKN